LRTLILVFCMICLPFWAVIVVGMISGFWQRLPFAVSAEFGPLGRFTVIDETGTSGVVEKFVVVIAFLMSV
jgi:hypothetical protein